MVEGVAGGVRPPVLNQQGRGVNREACDVKLLIAGCPGSGKGTQSARLCHVLGMPHISSGDLLRKAIRSGTPLGQRVAAYVENGRLAPDELVSELVQDRLSQRDVQARGFILDGYPRTLDQLGVLGSWLAPYQIDAAVELAVPTSAMLERLSARRRADDTMRTIRQRLEAFDRETRPMLRWLKQRGVLITVHADKPVGDVTAELLALLQPSPRLLQATNVR